jgi:c(7)-type cytochrome triheme protein
MRIFSTFSFALLLAGSGLVAVSAQEKKAPDKIVFTAKTGNVTFDHAKHVEREKNDCKVCHDKLFPQSRVPINFKAGMHKPAEAAKSSCGACHVAGGKSFPASATANCTTKCHVKAAAAAK